MINTLQNKGLQWGKLLVAASVLCIGAISCVKEVPVKEKAEYTVKTALNAIEEFQRNGGWAMAWTNDESATYGEWLLREDDIITIQPPATPGIGTTFLSAFEILKDSAYLQKAIEAGDVMILGQLDNGGFTQEFYPGKAKQDSAWFQHYGSDGKAWFPPDIEGSDIFLKSRSGTFDDATTQFATQFLLKLWIETGEQRFAEAAKRGAEFMLNAQYPNGGWPQKYPLQDNYTHDITLNDDAMMDVMRTLFMCSKVFNDARYYDAAIQGADYILELQGDVPQAGWAQQYTPEGEPIGARPWEPAVLSSLESVNVIEVLQEVYLITGDRKYLKAGQNALEWLKNSRLEDDSWARFYEIGTNKPVYGARGGKSSYDLQAALDFHPGYNWSGNYLDPKLEKEYEQLLNASVDERNEVKAVMSQPKPMENVQEKALAASTSMNGNGFWTTKMKGETLEFYQKKFGYDSEPPELINSENFTDKMNDLFEYLKRINQKQ